MSNCAPAFVVLDNQCSQSSCIPHDDRVSDTVSLALKNPKRTSNIELLQKQYVCCLCISGSSACSSDYASVEGTRLPVACAFSTMLVQLLDSVLLDCAHVYTKSMANWYHNIVLLGHVCSLAPFTTLNAHQESCNSKHVCLMTVLQ